MHSPLAVNFFELTRFNGSYFAKLAPELKAIKARKLKEILDPQIIGQ